MQRLVACLLPAVLLSLGCGDKDNKVCSPGAKTCTNDVLRTCNPEGSAYVDAACTPGCLNNSCPQCTPGTTRCEGTVSLTCAQDGSGWTQQSCTAGCEAVSGRCKTTACVAGEKRCSASSLLTCKGDGSGYTTSSCQYGCDSTTRTCKSQPCTPGTKTCKGSKLVDCKADGTGVSETACPYGCAVNGTSAACSDPVCEANTTRCDPDNPRQVQICKTDRTGWLNGSLCPNTCADGACVAAPICVEGEETCRENVAWHKDEIDRCGADNQWQMPAEVCTAGNCVDQGGTPRQYACGVCWRGARTCNGNDVLECTDPVTEPTPYMTCVLGYVCVVGLCAGNVQLDSGVLPPNHRKLAQAMTDCWLENGDMGRVDPVMCARVDAAALSWDLSWSDFNDWVCGWAVESDFDSKTQFDIAKDVAGCGWSLSDVAWRWDPLPSSVSEPACLWFKPDEGWFDGEELVVDHCSNFGVIR